MFSFWYCLYFIKHDNKYFLFTYPICYAMYKEEMNLSWVFWIKLIGELFSYLCQYK